MSDDDQNETVYLPREVYQREALGLLVLRLGLAWFLFVWALNKILAPGQYSRIWGYFHGIEIGQYLPIVMGIVQIVICLAIALGVWRTISYGLGFAMHSVTVFVIFNDLIHPFVINDTGYPVNRNNSVALAAWGAFAALWLLREHDYWSFDAWIQRKRANNQ